VVEEKGGREGKKRVGGRGGEGGESVIETEGGEKGGGGRGVVRAEGGGEEQSEGRVTGA